MLEHSTQSKAKDAVPEAQERLGSSENHEGRRDFFKQVGLGAVAASGIGAVAASGIGSALYSTSASAANVNTTGPTQMRPPEFSAIAHRAPWQLPDQARVAVMVVMNVEHFIFGKLGTAIQPHLTSSPEIANYGWRDYGNRVGIWRLFDLFDELQIPVTAAVNGDICTYYPEIIKGMQQRHWEFAGHGINNSTGHSGMAVEKEREVIQKTVDLLTQATGEKPIGWLTPGFSVTESTNALLYEAGIRYNLDWVNDDQPSWYPLGAGRATQEKMLSIPYTLEANDITLCLSAGLTGPQFFQAIVDQFDQLWSDGGTQPRVMTIGLHPFIVGQPLRLKYLKQALSHIKAKSNTWLTTGRQINQWMVTNRKA